MTANKSNTIQVTGIVEKCDVIKRTPYSVSRYTTSEQYDICLDVTVRLADGSAVYFKTPGIRMSVANCPVCAIVTYDVTGGGATWMKEVGENRVATREKPNDNNVVALVSVGDTVTIRGSVTGEKVSRAGNPYKTMNRVKRVS